MAPLTVDAQDRQAVWAPVWLITLAELQWVQTDFVQLDFVQQTADALRRFAGYDLDKLANPYYGRILDQPEITRETRDTFWGVVEVSEVSFSLANADHALDQYCLSADLRGTAVTIERYDVGSGTLSTELQGVVTQVELEPGQLTIHAINEDPSILEQEIPVGVVNTITFPKAVDAGAALQVGWGVLKKAPLLYVNDDVLNDQYDYLLPYELTGATWTIDALYRDGPGEGMFATIAASEYSVNTAAYSGYTVLRFSVRQASFSNGFHTLSADLTGATVGRNFARVIRQMLSNTTWGLGRTVDATTFNAVEAQIDPATGTAVTGLYADGALLGPRQAQDVLRDLLMVRGMRLGLTPSGTTAAWTLTLDTEQTTVAMLAGDGTGDGERNILEIGPRTKARIEDQVSVYALHYNLNLVSGIYENEVSRTVHPDLGHRRDLEHPYIKNHTTADKVIHYLSQREIYGGDCCRILLTQEARSLVVGDLIRVTDARVGYDAADLEVQRVTKRLDSVEVLVAGTGS